MSGYIFWHIWQSYFFKKKIKISDDTTSCLPTCPLREEKSFSQRAFSIYTDIRKLQDKAKTSYTLSTGGPGLAMNNSLAEVHPELVSEWSEKNLTLISHKKLFELASDAGAIYRIDGTVLIKTKQYPVIRNK